MSQNYEWSRQTYPIRDIISGLGIDIPFIGKVSTCYPHHRFGVEQVLFVDDVAQQKILIARGKRDRTFGIPTSCQKRVKITYPSGKVVCGALISNVVNAMIKEDQQFSMVFMNDEDMSNKYGDLRAINICDYQYLVVHTLINGDLRRTNITIAANDSMELSVAVGLTNDTQSEFDKVRSDIIAAAKPYRNDCIVGNEDIIELTQSSRNANVSAVPVNGPVSDNCDYDYCYSEQWQTTRLPITCRRRTPTPTDTLAILPRAPSKSKPPVLPQSTKPNRTPESTVTQDQDDDILGMDVSSMSVEEVSVCLKHLKMAEYVDELLNKDVDGNILCQLDETILTDDFKFSKYDARKLMLFVTEGYTPRTNRKRHT